jgi:uncharacterized membrane protein YhaH (DUF805 family)
MNNRFGPEPKSLDFGESVKICLSKYFVFEGRASRSEFWFFFLVYIVSNIVLEFTKTTNSTILIILSAIFSYGTIIPMVSAGCRRMHDIDKSGWFQMIPIYNLILWSQESSVSRSTRSKSTKERSPKNYKYDNNQSSSPSDLTDELEELKMLYEDGTLSEAQFKKAKKKLLK